MSTAAAIASAESRRRLDASELSARLVWGLSVRGPAQVLSVAGEGDDDPDAMAAVSIACPGDWRASLFFARSRFLASSLARPDGNLVRLAPTPAGAA